MWSYLGRRCLTAFMTLLGIATVVFAVVRLLPGDPAQVMLARSGASPLAVAALRSELGLDRPLAVQYLDWLTALARGDLGRSLFNGRAVVDLIREQLPYTLELAVAAFAVALPLGLTLGAVGARWPNSAAGRAAMVVSVAGVALPVFWSGLLLIWVFSVQLAWLPPAGADSWRALVMPALALGFATAGPIGRLTRASLMEVSVQPYVVVAHAKGLPERQVFVNHALRNAAVPLLTIAGLELGFLLGGAVVTETLFSRPGLGKLLVDAILWRDLPLVQGVVLVIASLYVITNAAVDVGAGWLSPQAGWQ